MRLCVKSRLEIYYTIFLYISHHPEWKVFKSYLVRNVKLGKTER